MNPIKHFQALYRASMPVKKIASRPYKEGYFMTPSPLSKAAKDTGASSPGCVGKFVSFFKELYSTIINAV